MVDQRFCPRIVEGELRYNLIGDSLIGVIHKKPKERSHGKRWQWWLGVLQKGAERGRTKKMRSGN